jgi:hypothetical protein
MWIDNKTIGPEQVWAGKKLSPIQSITDIMISHYYQISSFLYTFKSDEVDNCLFVMDGQGSPSRVHGLRMIIHLKQKKRTLCY